MEKASQQLKDNIICHKSAIKQINDKINLINFIDSVNHTFVPKELLNINELKQEKKSLEKNLKILTLNINN